MLRKEDDQKVVILFFLFGGGYEPVVKYSILRQGPRPFWSPSFFVIARRNDEAIQKG